MGDVDANGEQDELFESQAEPSTGTTNVEKDAEDADGQAEERARKKSKTAADEEEESGKAEN